MSVNIPPIPAVVPAQNNGIEPIICRDVLHLIFSHFSPKELFRCDAVNKEWRSVANDFLNQLEDPRGIQHPIYTRAEFIEKLRDDLARIHPDGELRLNVAQFRSKNRPCPTLKIIISCGPLNVPLDREKPPITIEAILDEVNRTLGDDRSRWSYHSIYHNHGSTLRIEGSAPEGGFSAEREIIAEEPLYLWNNSFLEAEFRQINIVGIVIIMVALATLAIFEHFNNS